MVRILITHSPRNSTIIIHPQSTRMISPSVLPFNRHLAVQFPGDREVWLPSNQIQPSVCVHTICLVLTSLRVGQPWLFQVYDSKTVTSDPQLFSDEGTVRQGLATPCSATNYFNSYFQRTLIDGCFSISCLEPK